METKLLTKKDLFAAGLTAAQIAAMVPVDRVKTGKPGRPAALYSQEQVDAVKAAPVMSVTTSVVTEAVTTEPEVDPTPPTQPVVATKVDAAEVMLADSAITEADLVAAA